ncbi:MAG: cell division protein SepF, partial [Promethearchaeota archaeon]
YDFKSLEQIHDIKKQLRARKILILNFRELLQDKQVPVELLKRTIDELKFFLSENGGSIGRLGEYYLILTPNSNVRMGF